MATNGYAHPEVLVETDWVAEHLNDAGLRFVEADEDILLYEQGHIPGAVKLDWHVDVQDPVQRDFVDKAGFEALMSRWGISNDTTVDLLRRPQQLVRLLQLLAVHVLRPREGADHERRPGQVGGRGPAAHPRGAEHQPDLVHRQGAGRQHPGVPRRRPGDARQPGLRAGGRALAGRVQRREAPHGGVRAGGRPAGRPRPGRAEHPLGHGRQRRRHLQVGRRAAGRSTAARASPTTSR